MTTEEQKELIDSWTYLPIEKCVRTRVRGRQKQRQLLNNTRLKAWIKEQDAIDLLVALGYVVTNPVDIRKEWEGEDDHY